MLVQKFRLYLMGNWETEKIFAYGVGCQNESFSQNFKNTGTIPGTELSSETDHPIEFLQARTGHKPGLPLLLVKRLSSAYKVH